MTSLAVERVMNSGTPDWRSVFGRVRSAVLRVPLLWKLLGANLVLVVLVGIEHYVFPGVSTVLELTALLVLSTAATGALGWLALRPVASLEATAERVSRGDFTARAPLSTIADRDMLQLTSTLNKLLDRVESDRARIHYLAGRGVRARDIERESVARELRDSFAQTLAGVGFQLTVAQRSANGDWASTVSQARLAIEELTEEMRSVAETLYPGTLAEFGLVNAIEALARRVSRRSGLTVDVDTDAFRAAIPANPGGALYRVAEEALRNVEHHAHARHVTVTLTSNGQVTLEIEDDGRGMDLKERDPLQAGLGLFSAKAVLALSGGELQISSGPGLGTRVIARVPLADQPQQERL